MRSLTFLVVVVLLAAVAPCEALAQADARLTGAVALAQEGHGDSARAIVQQVLGSVTSSDPLYVEALLARARLAESADTMRRQLQEITVEHALSPWADDALLALAELEYASGNIPAATRNLERFRSDYTASPLLSAAAFWAARAYFDTRNERAACEWVGMGLARIARAPADIAPQLEFFARRCPSTALAAGSAQLPPLPPADTIALVTTPDPGRPTMDPAPSPAARDTAVVLQPPPHDSLRRDPGVIIARLDTAGQTPTPAPARPPEPGPRLYRVQVVAASNAADAAAAIERLKANGYDGRVVQEGGFHKVRAGGWPTRNGARAALPALSALFPGAFAVRDP
jgi:cell division septation protein DedD